MSSQNNYNIIRRNDMSGYLRQWLRHDICQFTAIAKKRTRLLLKDGKTLSDIKKPKTFNTTCQDSKFIYYLFTRTTCG